MLLCNQKFIKQPTLINLYLNEYSQELHYSVFEVKLDRYVRSCNTINRLANKEFVQKKTEHLNLSMFNMITGIYELKTKAKHISCKCKCKFDCRNCSSNQKWNNDKCQCECKKHHIYQKDDIWNPATCCCKNSKYLANVTDDSIITCDEIIDAKVKSYDEGT